MKRTMLSVFLAVQVLALAFVGNMLSPLISPETGDLIGIAFMSPFIIGALALVVLISVGLLIYAGIKKQHIGKTIAIVEVIFLILALILALTFLSSINII